MLTVRQVEYVDYGNRESVSASRLATLPVGSARLPAQSRLFALAGTAPPPPDWTQQSLECVVSILTPLC